MSTRLKPVRAQQTKKNPSGLQVVNSDQRLFAIVTMLAASIEEIAIDGQSPRLRRHAQLASAGLISRLSRSIVAIAAIISADR